MRRRKSNIHIHAPFAHQINGIEGKCIQKVLLHLNELADCDVWHIWWTWITPFGIQSTRRGILWDTKILQSSVRCSTVMTTLSDRKIPHIGTFWSSQRQKHLQYVCWGSHMSAVYLKHKMRAIVNALTLEEIIVFPDFNFLLFNTAATHHCMEREKFRPVPYIPHSSTGRWKDAANLPVEEAFLTYRLFIRGSGHLPLRPSFFLVVEHELWERAELWLRYKNRIVIGVIIRGFGYFADTDSSSIW